MSSEILIIGAGFSGAVMAERFASQLDKRVLVLQQDTSAAIALTIATKRASMCIATGRICFIPTSSGCGTICRSLPSGAATNIRY